MLWLALNLPELPLEALSRGLAFTTPVVVLDQEQRVWQASPPGRRAGIHPGMSAAAARARVPGLVCLSRDPAAEVAALVRLADWLYSYSPQVSLAPPDGLLLEVGGSLALFGSLHQLRRQLRRELRERGYRGQVGVAPTPLAAQVLAASGTMVTDLNALPGALDSQPLSALPLDAEQRALLRELRLDTLGTLRALPRVSLAQTLGPEPPAMLDRLLGLSPDPRPCHRPAPRFHTSLELPGVVDVAALAFPARRLLRELADWLTCCKQGLQHLDLTLELDNGQIVCLDLHLQRPGRDPAHWLELLRLRWARLTLSRPVITLRLCADRPLVLDGETAPLFIDTQTLDRRLEDLLEQLQARLGAGAVRGLACGADHRPERAWYLVEPGGGGENPALPGRPLWLLAEPLALDTPPPSTWLLDGPERIESGWWESDDVSRDYWRAQSERGERLWLFQERRGAHRWFLHGLFG